jgi:hypothetical protein
MELVMAAHEVCGHGVEPAGWAQRSASAGKTGGPAMPDALVKLWLDALALGARPEYPAPRPGLRQARRRAAP